MNVRRKLPGARARAYAAQTLKAVVDQGRSLNDALSDIETAFPDPRDRALIRRLVARSLADLTALQWRLARLVQRPLPRSARNVHFLLLTALSELIDAREPAPAVIHASVEATRALKCPHLAKLVNGVLRNWLRQGADLERMRPTDPVHAFGYPAWLIDALREDWPDDWAAILAAGNQSPPLWLRVNRRRSSPDRLRARLETAGIEAIFDPRFPDALKLARPARISALPGFTEGEFSVQDAGAQAAVELVAPSDGQRVLDACAAPGGKAAHILERADVALTALDIDPKRCRDIESGLARLGLKAEVLVADALLPDAWWDQKPFDRILIDAPCSGTGVIRRHPDIRWLRRPEDIPAMRRIQGGLLESLWPLLASGGRLVYATCSILRAENDELLRDFVARHADVRVLEPAVPEARALDPGAQTLPGNLDRDGFYYAVLERVPKR
ncbi:MAG: 16S rRNA (cytosine(967)-C(5))-methyltransferase RsmB [Wenzhouxiangellaceae bacterium]